MTWQDEAACRGLAPHFDECEPRASHILVCAECPVRRECLAESLTFTRERDFGIWGGLGRIQRARVRRQPTLARQIIAAAAEWHRNLQVADAHR